MGRCLLHAALLCPAPASATNACASSQETADELAHPPQHTGAQHWMTVLACWRAAYSRSNHCNSKYFSTLAQAACVLDQAGACVHGRPVPNRQEQECLIHEQLCWMGAATCARASRARPGRARRERWACRSGAWAAAPPRSGTGAAWPRARSGGAPGRTSAAGSAGPGRPPTRPETPAVGHPPSRAGSCGGLFNRRRSRLHGRYTRSRPAADMPGRTMRAGGHPHAVHESSKPLHSVLRQG